MKKQANVLVTGATGFIGTHLVYQLSQRGFRVRALCRRNRLEPIPGKPTASHPLKARNVQLVRGDVTDRGSLDRALEGCDYVFHVAGLAQQWQKDASNYYRVNVDGVENILTAAETAKVKKTVVTSTIVTFGPTEKSQVGDESMPRNTEAYFTEYEKSKAMGEQVALSFAQRGAPITIVNPTRVFGPGYLNDGNSVTKLIDDYDRGRFPFLLNGGANVGNYVFVDDVVDGHILAMQKGKVGERYILGSENISLKGFFEVVARLKGKKTFQMSATMIPKMVAWGYQKRADWFSIAPQISPGWLNTFLADWSFDCDKARRQLGYCPMPLNEAIHRTYRWVVGLRKQSRIPKAVPAISTWQSSNVRSAT